jgi:hypothetical protein
VDDGVPYHRKVVLEQDQVGRCTSNISGTIDRDTHVRGVQRWGIVDAVPHEADNIAQPLQRQQYPQLLLRVDPTEQVDPWQQSDQCFLRKMRERVTREHTGDLNAISAKTWRVTRSLSPVSTFTEIPAAAMAWIVALALAFGGSRETAKPEKPSALSSVTVAVS